ncbi:MAG: flagellar protein [Lachnospiraceae bacterium]|nr:flagellar protein [Lachnospiraceae bacterium]
MRVMNGQYPSLEQLAGQLPPKEAPKAGTEGGEKGAFADILSRKQKPLSNSEQPIQRNAGEIRFSKHASLRLSDRNIELSDGQLERLTNGTQKAGEKGINESLVIMDELAFIVNVKNNTVITAMDQSEADENVFTNIDGAVIV